jgi:hypothetical protein
MPILDAKEAREDHGRMARCERHAFEHAIATCESCVGLFCEDCIVHPAGPKQPPLCLPCALVAAGVRRRSRAELAEAKRRRKLQAGVPAPAAGRSMLSLIAAAGMTAALAVPILSRVS